MEEPTAVALGNTFGWKKGEGGFLRCGACVRGDTKPYPATNGELGRETERALTQRDICPLLFSGIQKCQIQLGCLNKRTSTLRVTCARVSLPGRMCCKQPRNSHLYHSKGPPSFEAATQ